MLVCLGSSVFLTTQKRHSKLKSRSHSLSSSLRGNFPYDKLFSVLPNSSITDRSVPCVCLWYLCSLMGKRLCFKTLSIHTFVRHSCCLHPHISYNWCPRVTCTFKWEWLVIIHSLSFINTGKDTRSFINSPSYLDSLGLNVECHQLISLLPI